MVLSLALQSPFWDYRIAGCCSLSQPRRSRRSYGNVDSSLTFQLLPVEHAFSNASSSHSKDPLFFNFCFDEIDRGYPGIG